MELDCILCNGLGKIYDPTVDSDPIEGYKMTPRIICNLCGGRKKINLVLTDQQILKAHHDLMVKNIGEKIQGKITADPASITNAVKKVLKDAFE